MGEHAGTTARKHVERVAGESTGTTVEHVGGTRHTTCLFCDGGCALAVDVDEAGEFKVRPANPQMPALCSKARKINEYRFHPDRVTRPLKNRGDRGSAQWEPISWDEALDEIALRLQKVAKFWGPEAIAFAETPLNLGFGGITRRLMNCLGTPNYTAPTQLCMGNTAQVHRAVYGWLANADWDHADCVVYFGQNRDEERWPGEYFKLNAALERGATLISIDPRATETAKRAHYHLPIRYGTDAALALGWIHVIIEEELYDKAFVREFCTGFDELAERVQAYPPDKVAALCGVDEELVRETARVYARAESAIIPWGVVGDMQVNSTSLLQAQCILRSICGFVGKSERVFGPAKGGVGVSKLAAFDLLDEAQRQKQLGRNTHPLLTFAASDLYKEANARHDIDYTPDILAESASCVPPQLFTAMRGEGPYAVKAIVVAGNNTVMSYAGQQGIIDAFLNQDLVVVFENWMTPTAQLADFVLPGDMWAERASLGPSYDVAPVFTASQALCEPVGECKSWYFVVKGLADRLGYSDVFPWENEAELNDFRLSELGITWKEALRRAPSPIARKAVAAGSYVTPSGKIELASSVLETLGFDPLPYYKEPEDPGAASGDFPYVLFSGLREKKSYNTCLHQIASLRKLEPEPLVLLNPVDASAEGVADGAWCKVSSAYGSVRLMAKADAAQPQGTLRIPHGWWKPETSQGFEGDLSGACLYNDAVLFPDDEWNLDAVQGVPNLRGGIHGRIECL